LIDFLERKKILRKAQKGVLEYKASLITAKQIKKAVKTA
jgi:hypothetical protein